MLHTLSLEKCTLKQRDTTTRLLEWAKSRTLTTPNAGKDVQELSSSLVGVQHGAAASEDSVTAAYRT